MKKLLLIFLFSLPLQADEPLFQPPPVTLIELPSGMTLLLLEDHEFPTIELWGYLRGGSVLDPKGKEGLAALAMNGIRYGGGQGHRSQKIEEELEQKGISLTVGTGTEFSFISLRSLKKDFPRGLEILFDLLKSPAFEKEQIALLKEQAREQLLREKEEPLSFALREFPAIVYGPKQSWGRVPTPQSIKKISHKDLLEFYQTYLFPDRWVMGLSGDFEVMEIVRDFKIQTADWQKSGRMLPPFPPVKREFASEQWWISRNDLQQATVVMGHLGSRRDNPDKFALLLFNYILGGSGALSSRLGEAIRVKEGQAYSVWSHFGFGPEEGLFWITVQTATPQLKPVVDQINQMVKSIANDPQFTDEEIQRAKQAILRSLYHDYETRAALVKDLAKFYLWGYPPNYLEIFQQSIRRLSRQDLERVKDYFHPDQMKLLVVGSKEVKRSKWGRIKEWKR